MPMPGVTVTEVDRPEICETFGDSIGLATFDGNTARIEICVHRYKGPVQGKPPMADKVPSARLVLTPEALEGLFNFLNGVNAAIKQAQKQQQPPPPAKH